jgi:hypothetical protein
MDQKPLARLQPAAHDHIRPDGEAGLGQAGGLAQAMPFGHRQRMGRRAQAAYSA